MKSIVLNIEANGLKPDKIWCITCLDLNTGEEHAFRRPDISTESFLYFWRDVADVIVHNGISYDCPNLCRLIDRELFVEKRVVDTLVISRLLDYSRAGGHSLAAWAPVVGVEKTVQPPWDEFSEALVDHSMQNCRITAALYRTFLPYLNSPRWQPAIETEMKVQTYLQQMHENGFYLDIDKVKELRYNILREVE
ncbi:MAG TPA: ribonuclease H-like domain-containing protein, partial [bacterium]|nr:ribonuclease H-like domain-containing protein [bacterium]